MDNKEIKNSFFINLIESQLANTQIGISSVVNNINIMDIPSIPNCILIFNGAKLTQFNSTTCWNSAVPNSKLIQTLTDSKKVMIDVINAISLTFSFAKNNVMIPTNGTMINVVQPL